MKNKKFIIIAIVIFIAGLSMGVLGRTRLVTREVIKEVPVEKVVEVEKNTDTWKALKDVDDLGFVIASEQMGLCSRGFTAISNLDVAEMKQVTKEVNDNTNILTGLIVDRKELLKKLGY